MAIYDISGNSLGAAYGKDGSALSAAYDKAGNTVWTAGPISLRVCSYNVGGWYIGSGTNVPADKDATYYALQNGTITDIDADILCMQEFWTQFSKLPRTAESLLSQYYPYIRTADGTATYTGRSICSKYPILSYTRHRFSGENRYYDDAGISVNGKTVHVFVTHLHPSDPSAKIREATELFSFIQSQGYTDYIVCGDFNSTLYDPFSETNAAIYNQFINAGCTLANAGAFGIKPTACNSANWSADSFAIDNIIAHGLSIDAVATDTRKTTDSAFLADGKIDHIPIYADLTLALGT